MHCRVARLQHFAVFIRQQRQTRQYGSFFFTFCASLLRLIRLLSHFSVVFLLLLVLRLEKKSSNHEHKKRSHEKRIKNFFWVPRICTHIECGTANNWTVIQFINDFVIVDAAECEMFFWVCRFGLLEVSCPFSRLIFGLCDLFTFNFNVFKMREYMRKS